jgi:single-stranded-DNA-specific exonuclease
MLNATSLAAIGTVADVVDLRGENRVLTRFGLQALPESKLCGLRALIESAGLKGQGVDSYAIGFRLAPVLNAAGRMGHARLRLLLIAPARCGRTDRQYLKNRTPAAAMRAEDAQASATRSSSVA